MNNNSNPFVHDICKFTFHALTQKLSLLTTNFVCKTSTIYSKLLLLSFVSPPSENLNSDKIAYTSTTTSASASQPKTSLCLVNTIIVAVYQFPIVPLCLRTSSSGPSLWHEFSQIPRIPLFATSCTVLLFLHGSFSLSENLS